MTNKPPKELQPWIEAKKMHRLSQMHIQMARELGMNPKKFGKLDNHKQELWKAPLPHFIEDLYMKRFGKKAPDVVLSFEEIKKLKVQKKEVAKQRKALNRAANSFNFTENQNMEYLAHKQIGSGKEKVLVMHNWLGDSTSYDFMLPYLNTDDNTYVFVDLRGYGGSKEMKGTFSIEEASSDAIKLIDFLAWNKFHLIGHSMSGMIVQKIAVDNPTRVKSVVAITPVPACGSPGPKEMMDFFESAALDNDGAAIECVNTLTSNRYTNAFGKKMVSDNRQRSTSEARLGYMNMFFHTDFSESVKGLLTPILVLIGEHDFEGSEAFMRNTFLKWYPNAQLECCKASGHYPMVETPVALVSTIEKFLSAHSSDSAP